MVTVATDPTSVAPPRALASFTWNDSLGPFTSSRVMG